MALIEETIRIEATVAPPGESVRDFGRGMYLTRATTVVNDPDEAQLIRSPKSYPTITALEEDSPGGDIVDAGRAWFSANPHPRSLLIGSQIAVDQPSFIFGSDDRDTGGNIEALGDGVSVTLGGNAVTLDLDTQNTYSKIAAAVQTGIRAVGAYAAATVTSSGGRFTVQGGTGYDFGDGFNDTPATRALGLYGGAGAVIVSNVAAEDMDAALARIEAIDSDFFWVGVSPEISQDYTLLDSVRDWVAARRLQVGAIFDVFGEGVLTANETTSIGALLSAQGGDGIAAIYNGSTPGSVDHKGLRYAARFSSVNFNQRASDINGKFLTLPGAIPTPLTSSQRAVLDGKRINWYVPIGAGSQATGEGVSFGTWIDVYYFLSWFSSALRTAAWNHLRSSSVQGGAPLTAAGMASIAGSLAPVCEQAVRFGAIAPNTVSPITRRAIQVATDNEDFDGVLSTGYLIVPPRVTDLSQTVRDNRGPVPIRIFAKGSGKVNYLDIALTLEN